MLAELLTVGIFKNYENLMTRTYANDSYVFYRTLQNLSINNDIVSRVNANAMTSIITYSVQNCRHKVTTLHTFSEYILGLVTP